VFVHQSRTLALRRFDKGSQAIPGKKPVFIAGQVVGGIIQNLDLIGDRAFIVIRRWRAEIGRRQPDGG
jgi:hypothetical protein